MAEREVDVDVDGDVEELLGSMGPDGGDHDDEDYEEGTGDDDEDDDDLSENELNVIQQFEMDHEEVEGKEATGGEGLESGRLYQDDLCKPVANVGGIKLGMSKAKLFGLLDENGNVNLHPKGRGAYSHGVKQDKNKMKSLSQPRKDVAAEEEKLDFKVPKNKAALHAMNDKGCGYDFIERLENGADFMTRLEVIGPAVWA